MKKYIYGLLTTLILAFSFSGCEDYLDVEHHFNDMLTLDSAFTKRNYAEGFLANAWSRMYECISDIAAPNAGNGDMGGNFNYASDDLIFGSGGDGNLCRVYQNCEYNSVDEKEDRWGRTYEAIRKASTVIHKIDYCREMTLAERQDTKAQARFLRAYAYWVLLRQYGPIPIMPDEGLDVSMSYEELSIPRSTYDQCIEFITNDFALAAVNLPLIRTASNVGRPSKGAALAARAKVLLYAASPLYNGNSELFDLKNQDGTNLISQTYDEKKWALAAAAAKEVIDLAEGFDLYALHTATASSTTVIQNHPEYSTKPFPHGWQDIDPYESYRQIFNYSISITNNKELIFTRSNDRKDDILQIVRLSMPKSLGGENTLAVSLKQVNAYAMSDGRSISEAIGTGDYKTNLFTGSSDEYPHLGANVNLMFANREPRFYASIAYPGSIWECESAIKTEHKNKQVFYYRNTPDDGKNPSRPQGYPRTGIGLKKYVHSEDSFKEGGYVFLKYEMAIRYADVLLWYAEALNELTRSYDIPDYINQNTITVTRSVASLQSAIKPIRMRAGVPDYRASDYTSVDNFRRLLKRERQIELFAEASRYWDLRRWKDAPIEENSPIMGFSMDMNDNEQQKLLFYNPAIVTSIPKVFLRKMYLWPIPSQSEMKRNPYLVQNPDWN